MLAKLNGKRFEILRASLRAPSGAVESPKCAQEQWLALAELALEKLWENKSHIASLSLRHICGGQRLAVQGGWIVGRARRWRCGRNSLDWCSNRQRGPCGKLKFVIHPALPD
jgi:hypothetical protein